MNITSTYNSDWNSKPLTVEKLLEAKKLIEENMPACPFQKFAEKYGFDLNRDLMAIAANDPAAIKLSRHQLPKNVILSPHIKEGVVFLKDCGVKPNTAIKADPEKAASNEWNVLPYPLPFT